MENSHLARSENQFELEWVLYTANYIIIVHMFYVMYRSLICMEDRDRCMHKYSNQCDKW